MKPVPWLPSAARISASHCGYVLWTSSSSKEGPDSKVLTLLTPHLRQTIHIWIENILIYEIEPVGLTLRSDGSLDRRRFLMKQGHECISHGGYPKGFFCYYSRHWGRWVARLSAQILANCSDPIAFRNKITRTTALGTNKGSNCKTTLFPNEVSATRSMSCFFYSSHYRPRPIRLDRKAIYKLNNLSNPPKLTLLVRTGLKPLLESL